MGCGISRIGPNVPLYTNEFTPPIHELVPISASFPESFPPSGLIKNDLGLFFDDREFIKQCQIVHIQEVIVYLEKYITGIEILYFLDGAMRDVKHCCEKPAKKHSMPIASTDSIVVCEATYTGDKIHSIRLETNEGGLLNVESSLGPGKEKKIVNLRAQRRGVVAFKGKIGEYLEGISTYSWRMCGKNRSG